MDPISGDVIRRLLGRFIGSGSTVLFPSHATELVEQVCDRFSILDNGKILKTGSTGQVRGKTLQKVARCLLVFPGTARQRKGLSLSLAVTCTNRHHAVFPSRV